MAAGPWYLLLWRGIDRRLAALSRRLQGILRTIRIVRATLVASVLVVLACAGAAVWRPEYLPYLFAISSVFLLIPLLALTMLVGLPLRAKRIVRLIDKGYPGNARELAIRGWARKLRDESIETEELLVETALNESKKALRMYRERAGRMKAERAAQAAADEAAADAASAQRAAHEAAGAAAAAAAAAARAAGGEPPAAGKP